MSCLFACYEKNAISSKNVEKAFISTGYTDWKNALEKKKGFSKHQSSDSHKEATERRITAPAQVKGDVDQLFSSKKVLDEQKRNREILSTIVSNIRYLGGQGLAFRGNWDKESACEFNSNFHQLNLLRSNGIPGTEN